MANILVVDDETSLLQLVTMILGQAGHTVLSASSGVEALMVFASYPHKFDLILSDVLMPGMTGIELVRRIRALDPSVKVLLMSGFVPEGVEVPGDLRLFKKPFAPADLLATVKQELAANLES
jgi:CheY-like chemotaxis protein